MTTSVIDQTLYLSGDLTLQQVGALWAEHEKWLQQEIKQLDLAQVDTIDSSGLAFLVTLTALIASQNVELIWKNYPNSLVSLMKLYDLELKSARLISI